MKNKLFFKVPSSADRALDREYFKSDYQSNEWFEPSFAHKVEFAIYDMICTVRRRRLSYEYKGVQFVVDSEAKTLLRKVIKQLRITWNVFCTADEQAVKYELSIAENWLQKACGMIDAAVISRSLVKAQHASFTNAKSANKPRKDVSKNALIEHRDNYVYERARNGESSPLRGWVNAACIEFKITSKTLNSRLKE